MITIEDVKNAQRINPNSEDTKEMQRAYEAQRNEDLREQRAEEQRAEAEELEAENSKMFERMSKVSRRETIEISSGPHSDFSNDNFARAMKRRGKIALNVGIPEVYDDEFFGYGPGELFLGKILDAREGAYYSDPARGISGWYVIYTVSIPKQYECSPIIA